VCELYGDGDPVAGAAFARILDDEAPYVVHMHAFTRAVSLEILRFAKQRGIPTFFTYRTPTASSQRGALMLSGREVCDLVLDVRRCGLLTVAEGLPRLGKHAVELPAVAICKSGRTHEFERRFVDRAADERFDSLAMRGVPSARGRGRWNRCSKRMGEDAPDPKRSPAIEDHVVSACAERSPEQTGKTR
jgi:hypothetical protein